VAIYVGIERFGIRIPLRPFFAVTGATLYLMAFVFAGTGIKELQEGALIPTTLVRGAPRSDFLGLYPTVESLAVQGLLVAGVIVAIAWTLVRRRAARLARAASGPAVPALPRETRPQETR
jgi:high-affinity iron transporter